MKSASRRSLLQVRILLRLELRPFRTISELAMAVGARRPSVSRSLKTLRGDKLVVRNRDGWTLTLAGEEEAKRSHQELSRVADNLRRTVQGNTVVDLMKSVSPIPESLVGGVLANTVGSASITSLAEAQRRLTVAGETVQSIASLAEVQRPLRGFGEIVQSIASSSEVQRPLIGFGEILQSIASSAEVQGSLTGVGEIVQSLAPLAETHHALSGAIARSMAVPNLGLIISRNSAMVAQAIENIQSVCSAPEIRMHGFDKVLYPGEGQGHTRHRRIPVHVVERDRRGQRRFVRASSPPGRECWCLARRLPSGHTRCALPSHSNEKRTVCPHLAYRTGLNPQGGA